MASISDKAFVTRCTLAGIVISAESLLSAAADVARGNRDEVPIEFLSACMEAERLAHMAVDALPGLMEYLRQRTGNHSIDLSTLANQE